MAKPAKTTTTTTRRTARKPAAGSSPAATKRAAPAKAAATPAADTAPKAAETPAKDLKKPELIRRVVETSGMKKKDVKPVVEAMLKELGDALTNGETMNLQPFGKVQVNRTVDKGNGEVLVVKVRRNQLKALQTEREQIVS